MGSLSPALSSAPGLSVFSTPPLHAAGNRSRRTAPKANGRAQRGYLRTGPRNRVLIFGNIRELALYRAEVLRTNGFSVATPQSKAEAIAAIQRGGLDAVVLSYTLSNDTVEELAELVRQHCAGCRLITISDSRQWDPKIEPDANVL
ncbi:MAG TPA: hypothetical protein VLC12_15420, partial [Terriglobales bacterium]|nr:hypothetical protein [Terriglobales bacterium]